MHGEGAAGLGHGAQVDGIAHELGLGALGLDDLLTVAGRGHAHNAAAALIEVAEDIAHVLIGHGDLQLASVDSFIKTLPDGYDFELSTGAENISQGQRQLLTIARAMASDPEIMILDEATSNVDTHTEQLIQKALAKLMHGRTSFVIAHRLSTIRDADMILYMEHGDILEHGSHEELMAQHGKYEALYMSQFAQ